MQDSSCQNFTNFALAPHGFVNRLAGKSLLVQGKLTKGYFKSSNEYAVNPRNLEVGISWVSVHLFGMKFRKIAAFGKLHSGNWRIALWLGIIAFACCR